MRIQRKKILKRSDQGKCEVPSEKLCFGHLFLLLWRTAPPTVGAILSPFTLWSGNAVGHIALSWASQSLWEFGD